MIKLHQQLRGDYLFAAELHEDSECPFHESLIVPIERPEPQHAFQPA